METKTSKFNKTVILSMVVVIILLILIVSGTFVKPEALVDNNQKDETKESNDKNLLETIEWLFIVGITLIAILYAFLYYNKKALELDNEHVLILVRNYIHKHLDTLSFNDSLNNMTVESFGDIIFVYLRDINVTFKVDKKTSFISHNKITMAHAVKQVNTNDFMKEVMSGSPVKDLFIENLRNKGFAKTDVENAITSMESKISD